LHHKQKSVRDKILLLVIGAVVSAVATLIVGIYGDLLPAVLPALERVPAGTYAKTIVLLLIVLALVAATCVILYMKSKPYRPRALAGTKFGYRWSAELEYDRRSGEVDIEVQWICPRHKVWLGAKSAEIPETTYSRLWCMKCNGFHDMMVGGAPMYAEEASRIIQRDILSRLRV
jgi:hypothetical protein